MLRRVLGNAAFFAGMQLYGQRFKYGTASTANFEQAMEDASGQTLDWYFNEWVYDKGLPTYQWGWQTFASLDPDQNLVRIVINQTQTNAPYFRMPVEFKVQRSARPDTFITVTNHAQASEAFTLTVNGSATNVVLDPRNSIYKRTQVITLDAPAPVPIAGVGVSLAASPNPARSASRFQVQLRGAVTEPVSLTIYDSGGRAVRVLGPIRPQGAAIAFDWDLRDRVGRRVPAGLYFARARSGSSYEDRSVIVLE
jgi:hypothetical protein